MKPGAPHRILIWVVVLAIVMPILLAVAGYAWLRSRLAEGVTIGETLLTVEGLEVGWGLSFSADSLGFQSEAFAAETGGIAGNIDLFHGLFRFQPAVDLDLDTVIIHAGKADPGADSLRKPPFQDPIPWPDIRVPAALEIQADRIGLRRKDSLVAAMEGVHLAIPLDQAALHAKRLIHPAINTLVASAEVHLDWSNRDTVDVRATLRRGPDTVRVMGRLPKSDVLEGRTRMTAHVLSSSPYAATGFLPTTLPVLEETELRLQGRLKDSMLLAADLITCVRISDSGLPVQPAPRNIHLEFSLGAKGGPWSLRSDGPGGERLRLEGRLLLPDTIEDWDKRLESSALTVEGRVVNLPLRLRKETVAVDLQLSEARLTREEVHFRLISGDRTALDAQLVRRPGGWSGRFGARVPQGERILEAYLDTAVRYSRLVLDGEFEPGRIRIDSRGYGMKAYGVMADSVHASHVLDSSAYVLRAGTLFRQGIAWQVRGSIRFAEGFNPIAFHAGNPRLGTLAFSMPARGIWEAEAGRLHLSTLPHEKMDSLPLRSPVLSGTFRWNRPAETGFLRADLRAAYSGLDVRLRGRARWTPDSLILPFLAESHGGSFLRAEARIQRGPHPFYALGKIDPEDVGSLVLEARDFDLAGAVNAFLRESPLASGRLNGVLSYGSSRGLQGEYRLEELALREAPAGLKLSGLSLRGDGDRVILEAVTRSDAVALLNDSLRVVVEGLRGERRRIRATVVAAECLAASFEGTLVGLEELSGDLGIRGSAMLPGDAGMLRNLDVRARLHLPLDSLMRGLVVHADTFRGIYAVPGLDTQWFQGRFTAGNGRLRIPELNVRNRQGQLLVGEARWNYQGETSVQAELEGENLALRLPGGRDAEMEQIRFYLHRDAAGLRLRGGFLKGRLRDDGAPLRLRVGLEDVEFTYRIPRDSPGDSGTGPPPSLALSATVRDSRLEYRLRSLEAIEDLFRRRPEPPAREPGRPLDLRLDLRAMGDSNVFSTDILRLTVVGDLEVTGTSRNPILSGRMRALSGDLGFQGQAYAVRRFEAEWPGVPPEEGKVELRAEKQLASNCEPGEQDSCTVTTMLEGNLSNLAFNYESDCGGGFGAAADVTALINSVRRGCYAPEFFAGGSGGAPGEMALGLLEPLVSRNVSRFVERLSGRWIRRTEVSGLAAFAEGSQAEEVALRLVSREFWRLRLIGRAAYHPGAQEFYNPWEYLMSAAWRPPFSRILENQPTARRLEKDLSLRATVETDPETRFRTEEDEIRRRMEALYDHGFWRFWWER